MTAVSPALVCGQQAKESQVAGQYDPSDTASTVKWFGH